MAQWGDEGVDVDVVIAGAGFAGLYAIHRLRSEGFTLRCFEAADDVGGTWYWNRYPGARCDIPTTDYTFGFDEGLEASWTWSEKYATQPEILRYAQHVTERFDLRRDITFRTRVEAATWDEATATWTVRTDGPDGAESVTCRFYVMATGCLSVPKEVDIAGTDRFTGERYWTSRWPHEGVDFTGKRVGVIGTGSSGIQSIPLIAEQATHLTVFQRTPNFSVPAHNGPLPEASVAALAADRAKYREEAKHSRGGIPDTEDLTTAAMCTPEEQRARFEAKYAKGGLFDILSVFADQSVDPKANEVVAELIREKIRTIVADPETAETLCPKDHYFGTKRPCLDTRYYETFNQPTVRLVDLRKTPITTITETGIETSDETVELDAIVFATGFDAMTGAIVGVDITGRDGRTLRKKWMDGPVTYLGLTTDGFPNLFLVTGPGSPSVLSNMVVSIEQHVDWIAECLGTLRARGIETIEPTPTAEAAWVQHVNDCADLTLHPTANSWYMGANVPGKPRVFLPYIGGVGSYRAACDEVLGQDLLGFRLAGPDGPTCNDGVIRRVQPDVAMLLEQMATMGAPAIETLSVDEARMFMGMAATMYPPGPTVAEEVDGTLPGPAGDLAYRLFRPEGAGPHPVLVWFHGGGWVLGDALSDAPICRDLCVRTGTVVISVDYRHAPEARFPAAADDAVAAVRWVADHAVELGGIPGRLAVGGWSAGGNLAAMVTQQLRDGGPAISAQLLVCPVTDATMSTASYEENAEGYVLTRGLMQWFFDHYVDQADRRDPRVSPLLAEDLTGLPPAVVVTCELDPLRDEGQAYAAALEGAGVPVTSIFGRGQTHTSLTMVDLLISPTPVRAEVADALSKVLSAATAPA
jgi:cation diffusion facilitator CzcD-associated flavoprotein CzcO/acetyl esterase/lipase